MTETELYPPLKEYFKNNGYTVRAEVKHADIIAFKDEEIIAVEMKIKMNLTVILQAVDHIGTADGVYIAIPVPPGRNPLRREKKLLRLLGLGLIYLNPDAPVNRVRIIFHPGPYKAPSRRKKREAIIREVNGRIGNFNTAGSSRVKLVTAYRQRVIQVACWLDQMGSAGAASLKKNGCPDDTGQILINNYYGWFERIRKGLYRLHPDGRKCLENYHEITEYFIRQFKQDNI